MKRNRLTEEDSQIEAGRRVRGKRDSVTGFVENVETLVDGLSDERINNAANVDVYVEMVAPVDDGGGGESSSEDPSDDDSEADEALDSGDDIDQNEISATGILYGGGGSMQEVVRPKRQRKAVDLEAISTIRHVSRTGRVGKKRTARGSVKRKKPRRDGNVVGKEKGWDVSSAAAVVKEEDIIVGLGGTGAVSKSSVRKPKGPITTTAATIATTTAATTATTTAVEDPVVSVAEPVLVSSASMILLNELTKVHGLLSKSRRQVAQLIGGASSSSLPLLEPSMIELVDLWLRILRLFQKRLREVAQWYVYVDHCILFLYIWMPFLHTN